MIEFVYYLHLFNEMSNMLVTESLLFKVLLDCYLLTHPFAQTHLPVAAFADLLNDFDLLLGNKKG